MIPYDRLGHRASTFRAVLERLPSHPLIVETGCAREADNWAGDGQSTLVFDAVGARVYSVDSSPVSVAYARSVVSARVTVTLQDSISFLLAFDQHIDLLYLDSLDFDGNKPLISATYHLFEFQAARHCLSDSILLVDDTSRRNGRWFGKGMLIADLLGEPFVEGETQAAWIVSN